MFSMAYILNMPASAKTGDLYNKKKKSTIPQGLQYN